MSVEDPVKKLGRRFGAGLAAGVMLAAVGLAVAGCSAAPVIISGPSTQVSGGAAIQGSLLGNAPWASAYASSGSSITPHSPLTGPPANPFAGTPASSWADGAAGIVLPAAGVVGGFTVAQVESAYETTRKLLIAAGLDRQTLLGGAPAAFAGLLTNDQRTWFLAGLDKTGKDKQGQDLNTREMVTSFAPGSAQLVGSVIKVRGMMRAQAATAKWGSPELVVHVDYLFVYAIQPPHQPTRWMRIVSEDKWTVSFANWAGAVTAFEPWVNENGRVAGIVCGAKDGYVHPDYPDNQGAQPTVSPTGMPRDAYAAGQKWSGCQATTGT